MVKNRNWQRRVEVASTRREENKQRKQRRDNRGIYKSQVHEMLDYLDQHRDSLTKNPSSCNGCSEVTHSSIILHIWTDEIPMDSPSFLEMFDEGTKEQQGKSGLRRMRSQSMEDNPGNAFSPNGSTRKGQQRGRSGSLGQQEGATINSSSSKRKIHPRSREALAPAANQEEEASSLGLAAVKLCRKHFFTGKCHESKGACRLFHYSPKYKTMSTILNRPSKTENSGVKDALSLSEAAYSGSLDESNSELEVGAMEMVYYFNVDLKLNASRHESTSNSSSDEEKNHVLLSDMIVSELSHKSCSIW